MLYYKYMKKFLALLVCSFAFFVFPSFASAETYTENFEGVQQGLIPPSPNTITGSIGTIMADFDNIPTRWTSVVVHDNCYSGNKCIESYGNLFRYTFNAEIIAFQNSNNVDYLSYYQYLPSSEDIDVGESVTGWTFVTSASTAGNMGTGYVVFCKESVATYSIKASTYNKLINNCDSNNLGVKVGTGYFNTYSRVDFKLNSVDGYFSYKLNNSDFAYFSVGSKDASLRSISPWYSGILDNNDDIVYGEGYDVWKFDDLQISDIDLSGGSYALDLYLGVLSETWFAEDIGCHAVNGEDIACTVDTPSYAMAIQSTSTSLVPNWKFEYELSDFDGNPLYSTIEKSLNYSRATLYNSEGTDYRTDTIIFPTMDKKAYLLKVCVGSNLSFPIALGEEGTDSICSNIYFGNGYTEEEFNALLVALGKVATSYKKDSSDVWIENGCNDIGLTEVFKGVKCALIYAFSPSDDSLSQFTETKNLMLSVYPIGYATLILSDVRNTLTSTSTSAFDKDIDVKKFFGKSGGTTTISVSNLTSKMGMVQPIIDFIDLLFWIAFVIWLLWWGLTRKL